MDKKYEEETKKVLTQLVSSDGEYRVYVKGLDESSDEYQSKVRQVKNYEESAKCTLTSEVMAIPHVQYDMDSYQAGAILLDSCNCSEDKFYVFKITKAEEMERIFKWGCLLSCGSTPSVGKKLIRQTKWHDGTPYDRPCWTRYASESGTRHEEVFDPDYFVGHNVAVAKGYDDDWIIIEGTLEDLEYSRKVMSKLVKEDLEELLNQDSEKTESI